MSNGKEVTIYFENESVNRMLGNSNKNNNQEDEIIKQSPYKIFMEACSKDFCYKELGIDNRYVDYYYEHNNQKKFIFDEKSFNDFLNCSVKEIYIKLKSNFAERPPKSYCERMKQIINSCFKETENNIINRILRSNKTEGYINLEVECCICEKKKKQSCYYHCAVCGKNFCKRCSYEHKDPMFEIKA